MYINSIRQVGGDSSARVGPRRLYQTFSFLTFTYEKIRTLGLFGMNNLLEFLQITGSIFLRPKNKNRCFNHCMRITVISIAWSWLIDEASNTFSIIRFAHETRNVTRPSKYAWNIIQESVFWRIIKPRKREHHRIRRTRGSVRLVYGPPPQQWSLTVLPFFSGMRAQKQGRDLFWSLRLLLFWLVGLDVVFWDSQFISPPSSRWRVFFFSNPLSCNPKR